MDAEGGGPNVTPCGVLPSPLDVEQTPTERLPHQFHDAVGVEFRHELGAMTFDGLHADRELLADRPVGEAISDETENLQLAGGERCRYRPSSVDDISGSRSDSDATGLR